MATQKRDLKTRLKNGENVLVAEGYIFELEHRGYLQAGPFVPIAVLDYPHVIRQLHEDFARAGSDVMLACTYYGHREKLELIGRSDCIDELNRKAVEIAKEVANKHGLLVAGNIPNSTFYDPADPDSEDKMRKSYIEQVKVAVESGVDFIVAETLAWQKEAEVALEVMKEYAPGVNTVVTMNPTTNDLAGVPVAQTCKQLEEKGADVVGLNCGRGPATLLPLIEEVRRACKGPIAALPVMYQTNEKSPYMQSLTDESGSQSFYEGLDRWLISRQEVRDFTRKCLEMDVRYLGLCCGNGPHYMRTMAEAAGRQTEASKFSPNMKLHFTFGDQEQFNPIYTEKLRALKLCRDT